MDILDLNGAIDKINQQTLPQIRDELAQMRTFISGEREAILKSVAMERAALMAEVINLRLVIEKLLTDGLWIGSGK